MDLYVHIYELFTHILLVGMGGLEIYVPLQFFRLSCLNRDAFTSHCLYKGWKWKKSVIIFMTFMYYEIYYICWNIKLIRQCLIVFLINLDSPTPEKNKNIYIFKYQKRGNNRTELWISFVHNMRLCSSRLFECSRLIEESF